MEGRVLEIQRMSTEDGPGIRTTVFLKGCSIKCLWCHNPESITAYFEVLWFQSRCIKCGLCKTACTSNALTEDESGIVINRDVCSSCGVCAETCPSGALEKMGRLWNVEEIVRELLKDRIYFEKSGGGITLSGGEATLQPEFACELLKRLKEEGIHTAVDTCGVTNSASLKLILPFTDILLFDLKTGNCKRHKEYTGTGNEMVIKNLSLAHSLDAKIWIRTPIVPGYTDDPENINEIAELIKTMVSESEKSGIIKWELLAFNNLCADKYNRLGLKWELEKTPIPDEKTMISLYKTGTKILSGSDKCNDIEIIWSGTVNEGAKK